MIVSTCFLQGFSVRIDCEYFADTFAISECATSNMKVLNRNETVSSISGTLLGVVDYAKIKSMRIEQSPHLEYFPTGLEKFFPNLEKLVITETGLKILEKEDLEVFPALKTLLINNNQLQRLNSNIFESNSDLENINLSDNKLDHVGADALKSLTKLKHVEMFNNVCINQTAQDDLEMKRLRISLRESCSSSKSIGNVVFFGFIGIFFLAILFMLVLVNVIKFIVKK